MRNSLQSWLWGVAPYLLLVRFTSRWLGLSGADSWVLRGLLACFGLALTVATLRWVRSKHRGAAGPAPSGPAAPENPDVRPVIDFLLRRARLLAGPLSVLRCRKVPQPVTATVEDLHGRARHLIDAEHVEGLSLQERTWLEAHLAACDVCAAWAASTQDLVRTLATVSVVLPPGLAATTSRRLRQDPVATSSPLPAHGASATQDPQLTREKRPAPDKKGNLDG